MMPLSAVLARGLGKTSLETLEFDPEIAKEVAQKLSQYARKHGHPDARAMALEYTCLRRTHDKKSDALGVESGRTTTYYGVASSHGQSLLLKGWPDEREALRQLNAQDARGAKPPVVRVTSAWKSRHVYLEPIPPPGDAATTPMGRLNAAIAALGTVNRGRIFNDARWRLMEDEGLPSRLEALTNPLHVSETVVEHASSYRLTFEGTPEISLLLDHKNLAEGPFFSVASRLPGHPTDSAYDRPTALAMGLPVPLRGSKNEAASRVAGQALRDLYLEACPGATWARATTKRARL